MAFPTLSVCREFSAERVNAVANHPGVRPWVGGGDGPLDLSGLVANPANVLLMGQGGGVLFQCLAPGLYEAHTQFVPDARDAGAVRAVKDALRWMFTRTDAIEIVTKVPDGNKPALGMVRAIHGQKLFERDGIWPVAGRFEAVSYYTLPIMAWAATADGIAASGEWFHGKLEAAKADRDGALPPHDDDPAHDRYVGATVEMIAAGQVDKGLAFYGRWAVFAGYGPIRAIAANPLVIDIGDALVAVRDDDFSVLLCR